MKPLISGLISLIAGYCISAQEKLYDIMPMDSGKVVYKKAVKEDSLSKEEIFNKIKAWADDYYKRNTSKLIKEDNGRGYLAYHAFSPFQSFFKTGSYDSPHRRELLYLLEFYVEKGRYRIIMRNLYTRDPQDLMTQILTLRPIEKYGKGSKKLKNEFKSDIEGIHKGIIKLYLDIIETVHN